MSQSNRDRMLGILDDTVKYYSEDITRRALEGAACKYRTKDNKRCAVGRLLTQEELDKWVLTAELMTIDRSGTGYETVLLRFESAPAAFAGLRTSFVMSLQALHDDNDNWNKDGLSSEAKAWVTEFRKNINAGIYD